MKLPEAAISNPPQAYLDIILPLIGSARGFMENGESLVPVAFAGNLTTQKTMSVMMNAGSDETKDESAAAIKHAAALIEADFVFVVMEAWSLRPDKLHKYDEILDKYGSIGDSPYAIDVVTLSLETRHGMWLAQMPIKPKGHSKKKRTFGLPEFRFFTEAKGRFVDLLPTKDNQPHPLH